MAESKILNKSSKGGWTHVMNSVAQDKRLSLDTRGLFLMMKSFPPDWEFNIPGLSTMGSCGKDKVRRMLKELEDAGYLLREQNHDQTGKFSGNTYVLQDDAPPLYEKTDDGDEEKTTVVGKTDDGVNRRRENPSSVFPTQTKEYIEINNTPYSPPNGDAPRKRKRAPKAVPEWQPDRFERFWAAYPRDEDRAKAVEQWDALPGDKVLMEQHGGDANHLLDEIARGLQRHLVCDEWKKDVGIPYAFRWLRDRRWKEKQRSGSTPQQFRPAPRASRVEIVDGEEVVVFDG